MILAPRTCGSASVKPREMVENGKDGESADTGRFFLPCGGLLTLPPDLTAKNAAKIQERFSPQCVTLCGALRVAADNLGKENMGIESLLIAMLIGAIAGWLAGQIVSGFGYGLLGNIVIGIVGAFIAGAILPRIGLGLGGGILAAIVHATIGAVILLFVIKLVKRA